MFGSEQRTSSIARRGLVHALTAAALVAVVLAVVVPAQGTPSATIQQRVAALEKKVRTLQASNKKLNEGLACIGRTVGLSIYGTPAQNAGYVYQNPDRTTVLATAIDFTPQGQRPNVFVPIVDQECVGRGIVLVRPERPKP